MRQAIVLSTVLVLSALGSVACEDETEPSAAPVTVTRVETTTVEGPTTTAAPPRRAAAPAAESASTRSDGIRVPNVVGRDHQLAQDTMQAAGLYNLAEEDATGQGRALLWDRNWVVVSQSPPAGSFVNEDATIVLRSKQDGE
jgi:hypothetical protein